ncbi:tyrosine-type recombinase/integrase [Halomicrobium salinisoli]|uniref:tyrosine-type recombinase/integrase n=1 Tax=Halomicrobium salinisoli TaxID=2878391 RepID=UPI001CF00F5E|nr:site-specific integrase [Halomicrobium salinisoli]
MPGPGDLSPREAKERFLDRRRTESSEKTVQSYHYRLKRFVEWAEDEGIESVRELSGWLLDEFETYRRGEGIASTTLNGEMQTVSVWVEYLASIDAVDPDLPEKVHVPEVPDGEESRDEILEHERGLKAIETYRNDPERYGSNHHAFLELAWFTGARLGALRALDLRDYHSDDQFVFFQHRPRSGTPLKNDSDGERAVGLPEPVSDVLDHYVQNNRWDQHDDHGRQPLLTTRRSRASENTLRTWSYLATMPCLYRDCPHGRERDTCDYIHVHHASKCPSSRSPHPIRHGSITWQRDRGIPAEIVAKRVNASIETIEKYYDEATERQRLEERRRPFLSRLSLDPEESPASNAGETQSNTNEITTHDAI